MGTQALVRRRVKKRKQKIPTDRKLDQRRAATAYFKLGTLLHDLADWGSDIARFKENGIAISGQEMVLESMRECSAVLRTAMKALGK